MDLNHFETMLLFALVVSVAFAALTKPTMRIRVRYAALVFLGFLLAALALGWLMFPFRR